MAGEKDGEKKPLLEKAADEAQEIASQTLERLIRLDQLPPWHQENEYIIRGYRPISNSVLGSLQSWTYLHNESVNIFSHLLPGIFAGALILVADQLFVARYPLASSTDRGMFVLFLLSTATCFVLSAAYHTLLNHSEEYAHSSLKADYCGILTMILGNFVSGEYVAFYCEPGTRKTYWTLVTLFTSVTALLILHPRYQAPHYRIHRLHAFVSLALSAFLPIVHGVALHGWGRRYAAHSGLYHYLAEGGALAAAAGIYAVRFPEKWSPGTFDIWGASHQIFHALTVVAAAVHFWGIWRAYDANYYHPRC